MDIKKSAVAGTLESSDCMVTVSVVIRQYGRQIRKVIYDTLKRLDVNDVKLTVVDKGALDCTIKARVECAIYRSNDIKGGLPWGGAIR